MQRKYIFTYEELYQKYIEEKKSARIIAKEIGCHEVTVVNNLKKLNIPVRKVPPPISDTSKDLSGMTFDRLRVLYRIKERRNGNVCWQCQCSCGKLITVKCSVLLAGTTKSCGCLKKDISRAKNKHFKEITGTCWARIKNNAKTRKLEFNISIEYAWNIFEKQDYLCALSGLPLTMRFGDEKGSASLDRIDSSKGYIEGNIEWIHKELQPMKWNYTKKHFINWCKIIVEYNKDKE